MLQRVMAVERYFHFTSVVHRKRRLSCARLYIRRQAGRVYRKQTKRSFVSLYCHKAVPVQRDLSFSLPSSFIILFPLEYIYRQVKDLSFQIIDFRSLLQDGMAFSRFSAHAPQILIRLAGKTKSHVLQQIWTRSPAASLAETR